MMGRMSSLVLCFMFFSYAHAQEAQEAAYRLEDFISFEDTFADIEEEFGVVIIEDARGVFIESTINAVASISEEFGVTIAFPDINDQSEYAALARGTFELEIQSEEQLAAMTALVQQASWSAYAIFEPMPVIQIVVEPVPPHDFGVRINGRRYQRSERYKVRAGREINLVVSREEREDCIWTGTLAAGEEETVHCNL